MREWKAIVAFAVVAGSLLAAISHKFPDHVFDATGHEIACGTPYGLQCVAAHCLQGYETIEWRDLGGSCTYRCKPQ